MVEVAAYAELWSQAEEIVGQQVGDTQLVAKVNGLLHQLSLLDVELDRKRDELRREERRIEEERARLKDEKLEVVGRLAAAVAHDFNNLMTAVLGNLDLALFQLPDSERKVAAYLERAVTAGRQVGALIQELRAFTGKGAFQGCAVDLNELVVGYTDSLASRGTEGIEVKVRSGGAMPVVNADPAQALQVIRTLLANATDAIGNGPGRIAVRTGVTYCDQDELRRHTVAPSVTAPGRFVFVEVSDSGPGMSPETMRRLFEPFYSTKKARRGLGLASVAGIVRSHRGLLAVESREGVGSTFRVLFPVFEAPEQSPRPQPEAAAGCREVLVVQEKDVVCVLGGQVIRHPRHHLGEEHSPVEIFKSSGDEMSRIFRERGLASRATLTPYHELTKSKSAPTA
ncbi:hypothetical protein GMSM_40620 [Geomonas sp. Red276]